MTSVDQSRGRPVRAGGSIASTVAARRVIALLRTTCSIARAWRRRCSDVQLIIGVPRRGFPVWALGARVAPGPNLARARSWSYLHGSQAGSPCARARARPDRGSTAGRPSLSRQPGTCLPRRLRQYRHRAGGAADESQRPLPQRLGGEDGVLRCSDHAPVGHAGLTSRVGALPSTVRRGSTRDPMPPASKQAGMRQGRGPSRGRSGAARLSAIPPRPPYLAGRDVLLGQSPTCLLAKPATRRFRSLERLTMRWPTSETMLDDTRDWSRRA
jgi:hypothetical protein